MIDNDKVEKKQVNIYYPTKAHKAQQIIKDDPARFKIIVAGRKFRKCEWQNTILQVIINDSVCLVFAKDLVGKDFEVYSLANDTKFYKTKATATFNGVNDIFQVRTSSGRTVEVTKNHPLLTITGWKEIKDLKVGDFVAVPTLYPEHGKNILDENLIKVVAYLIGDGGMTHSNPIFSQENNSQLEEFCSCIKKLGGEMKQCSKYDWRVKGLNGLFRDLGMLGKNSHQKIIPEKFTSLNRYQTAIFLSRLFSTDGFYSNKEFQKIGYCSVNYQLVKQIQLLLLRFGINVRINTKKTYCGVAHELSITTEKDLFQFARQIGIFGKLKRQETITKRLFKKTSNLTRYGHNHLAYDDIIQIEKVLKDETVAIEVPKYQNYISSMIEHNTSLIVSELMKGAMTTPLEYPYIGPSKVMARNMIWNDHVPRLLNHFKEVGYPYRMRDEDSTVYFPNSGGTFKIYGVDNADSLRGMSTWGGAGCLKANTKITTSKGYKKIKDIKVGEYVLTPTGQKKVLWSGITKKVKKLIEIKTSTGDKIVCTPDHKIFTPFGLVKSDELRYNQSICTNKYHLRSYLKELFLGYRMANIKGITGQELVVKHPISITLYGKKKTEKFLKDALSTMLMEINTTMSWEILPYSQKKSIMNIILLLGCETTNRFYPYELKEIFQNLLRTPKLKKQKQLQEKVSKLREYMRVYGMEVQKELNGIKNKGKEIGKIKQIGNGLKNFVKIAKNLIKPCILNDQNIVPQVVGIKSITLKKEIPVYNLTVEKDHCFFADDILVSNCDEYQDWDMDIWGLIIRPNLSVHKAWAYISGTPKGLNILYDMWQRGNPHSKNKMKDFKSFKFTSYDNPDLSTDELEAMKLEYLSQGGEDYFKQEMMAEFIKARGAVYKEWDFTTKFVDLKYDPNLPLHITFDFGVNDPTSIIWIQPMGSEIRIIDYYESSDASIEHYISVINGKPYKKAELYTGDIAGYSRTLTTGTSPIEIMNQKGIYLRTKAGVRIPDQIRATHTIMNRLYVKNTLNRVRDCLMNYRYPEDKALIKGNEIPVHNTFSHMARALEYWVINYANVIGSNYTRPEPDWVKGGSRKKIYG